MVRLIKNKKDVFAAKNVKEIWKTAKLRLLKNLKIWLVYKCFKWRLQIWIFTDYQVGKQECWITLELFWANCRWWSLKKKYIFTINVLYIKVIIEILGITLSNDKSRFIENNDTTIAFSFKILIQYCPIQNICHQLQSTF